jgi:NAD(P)H-dependent flavin oxidoreductase YrpB (nitropropane dioxygenase family)
MNFQTRLTDMFGMRYPILLGGMMWLSDANLVAAVVNGGGMGFITARSFTTKEIFREELRRCAELTAGKPFGVNLTLSRRFQANDTIEDLLTVALDEGVRHFETAGISPGEIVAQIHRGGGVIMHKCAHIRHALAAERLGVDAVCLVGMEEGGHPGSNQLPTFVNGAFALERLRIPLALGGGIGSGRQIAAALALGADGVVMGSRFLVAAEASAHPAYKQRVVESDEHGSIAVLSTLGDTWRVLDNQTSREVQRLEQEGKRRHEEFGDLIRGIRTKELVYIGGDPEAGMASMGPAAGFADRICPAAEIVEELMAEAIASAGRFVKRMA